MDRSQSRRRIIIVSVVAILLAASVTAWVDSARYPMVLMKDGQPLAGCWVLLVWINVSGKTPDIWMDGPYGLDENGRFVMWHPFGLPKGFVSFTVYKDPSFKDKVVSGQVMSVSRGCTVDWRGDKTVITQKSRFLFFKTESVITEGPITSIESPKDERQGSH